MPSKLIEVRTALRLFAGLALCALLIGAGAPALAQPVSLERLSEFLASTRTLSGNFSQTLYDESDEAVEQSWGEVHLERSKPNGRFRWMYRKPYPQEIVGDGTDVWVYDPELEQVTVRKIDAAMGDTPAALLAGDGQVDERFDVRDLGVRDGVAWVGLDPRSGAEGGFQSVALGFAEDSLSAMELVDAFGQRTVLEFGKLSVNQPLGADVFTFKPPAGADVLRE